MLLSIKNIHKQNELIYESTNQSSTRSLKPKTGSSKKSDVSSQSIEKMIEDVRADFNKQLATQREDLTAAFNKQLATQWEDLTAAFNEQLEYLNIRVNNCVQQHDPIHIRSLLDAARDKAAKLCDYESWEAARDANKGRSGWNNLKDEVHNKTGMSMRAVDLICDKSKYRDQGNNAAHHFVLESVQESTSRIKNENERQTFQEVLNFMTGPEI